MAFSPARQQDEALGAVCVHVNAESAWLCCLVWPGMCLLGTHAQTRCCLDLGTWSCSCLTSTGCLTSFSSPWPAIHFQHIWRFFYPSLALMSPNFICSVLSIYPSKDLPHSGSTQIHCQVSSCRQLSSRHVKDIFGTPTIQTPWLTRAFHKALLSGKPVMKLFTIESAGKKKKPSRNWPMLTRLTEKENVSLCCPVSLHEAVLSCLTLYIRALGDRDCHFNLYFSVLSTIVHDEASGHYSNINSTNKINTMAIPKAWLEKTTWSLHLSGPLFIQGQRGERAELSQ